MNRYISKDISFFVVGVILFLSGMGLLGSRLNWNTIFLQKTDVSIELRQAEEYLRQNSKIAARQALNILNRVLASNVNTATNQKAKYGIAAALEILEENAAALEYYRELQGEKITNTGIRDKVDYALGSFYLYLNHQEEGRSLLNSLLLRVKNKKMKSKIHTAFGVHYLRQKSYKRSEENFRIALKYDQENAKAAEGRAQSLKEQGFDWAAYRHYDNYLFTTANLYPKNKKKISDKLIQETFTSGVQAFRKGRYTVAIEFFKKICARTTNDEIEEEARFWIGESYNALGTKDKAIAAYNSVLKNRTTNRDAVALFKKGVILFHKDKGKEAAKVFKELQNNHPNNKYSHKSANYLNDIRQEKKEKYMMEDKYFTKDTLQKKVQEKEKTIVDDSNENKQSNIKEKRSNTNDTL